MCAFEEEIKKNLNKKKQQKTSSYQKNLFTMYFCLCGAILNLKIYCACMPDCLRRPTGTTSYRAKSKGPHNLTSTGPDHLS